MDSVLKSNEKKRTTENTVYELLRLHYKYGKLSFKCLRCMEKLDILPKKLEKCGTPTCAAYMYAKSNRKTWCGRSIKTPHKPQQVTNRGQIVLAEQLVSPTPGLVAQTTGIRTTKRYK